MQITLPQNQINYLRVKVIPKSSKSELVEILKEITEDGEVETYKIKIRAVPEKGKANEELVKYLSKELHIPKQNIVIISGKSAQVKLLKITT